jgi:hypothetical protein
MRRTTLLQFFSNMDFEKTGLLIIKRKAHYGAYD